MQSASQSRSQKCKKKNTKKSLFKNKSIRLPNMRNWNQNAIVFSKGLQFKIIFTFFVLK